MIANKVEIFKIFLLNQKKHWHHNQQIRYLAIGAWNTAAGYGIFVGLYFALREHAGYIAIAMISHFLAVTQSFLTQRHLVFRSERCWHEEYIRFNLTHLGTLLVGLGSLSIMIEGFNTPPLIAQATITFVVVISSYFIHKHFTFQNSESAPTAVPDTEKS